jgi:hypothetical protein
MHVPSLSGLLELGEAESSITCLLVQVHSLEILYI